jgi:hypothetical protein
MNKDDVEKLLEGMDMFMVYYVLSQVYIKYV